MRNAAKVFLAKILAEVHLHIPIPAQRVGNRLSGQTFPGGLVKVEASESKWYSIFYCFPRNLEEFLLHQPLTQFTKNSFSYHQI